jgi:SAM-dependent methyltransferase
MTLNTAFNWSEICRTVGPCIRPGGPALTERALEICSLPAGSRVADLGCGAGGTLQHLERTGLYRLVGLDPSENFLGEAATRLKSARLARGRAEAIPFRSGTFDALFCECVLSILEDTSVALEEFARGLRDGGFLVVSDLFSKDGQEQPGRADGLLTRADLQGLLAERGFTLLLWEEHERLLKEFAVRMILAGERLPDTWGCNRGRDENRTVRTRISYYLMVARKNGAIDGVNRNRE